MKLNRFFRSLLLAGFLTGTTEGVENFTGIWHVTGPTGMDSNGERVQISEGFYHFNQEGTNILGRYEYSDPSLTSKLTGQVSSNRVEARVTRLGNAVNSQGKPYSWTFRGKLENEKLRGEGSSWGYNAKRVETNEYLRIKKKMNDDYSSSQSPTQTL